MGKRRGRRCGRQWGWRGGSGAGGEEEQEVWEVVGTEKRRWYWGEEEEEVWEAGGMKRRRSNWGVVEEEEEYLYRCSSPHHSSHVLKLDGRVTSVATQLTCSLIP
ncbi:unnamed protein product [Arctogadus glacialis]